MKITEEVEKPMGNTELRLILAGIEEEIGDIKGIALDTKAQAIHTNGTVKWQTKMIYLAMGALAILAPISGWLCTSLIADEKQLAALKATSSPNAITTAVNNAFATYHSIN